MQFVWTLVFVLGLSYVVNSQDLCTGNLGVNIFLDGDFGSGQQVILATDPGIAPGYQYQNNPPPNDGFYTITNNMSLWGYTFPGWMTIQDNSDDPQGYFMVVNASFEPGKFYEQTIDGLCENTTYQFSADIINIISPASESLILPNVAFFLDDQIQFSTGDITQNGQWNTYGFSFTTIPGQTSITLSVRNNAPGGFGNDLGLDNIQFQPCGPKSFIDTEETIFLCESQNEPAVLTADIDSDQFVIQWQTSTDGITWQDVAGANDPVILHTDFSVGVYFYRYLSSGSESNLLNEKCRIISDLIMIEVVPMDYFVMDTLCNGFEYIFGTQVLTEAGIYEEPFVSSIGCDSIVTLNLTIAIKSGFDLDFVASDPSCFGFSDGSIDLAEVEGFCQPYNLYLDDLLQESFSLSNIGSGSYNFTVIDRFGCEEDSIIILSDPEEFVVSLPEDQTVVLGTGVDIVATSTYDNASYIWSPGDYLDCTDCLDNFSLPANSTSYTITGTNEAGCISSDMILVTVDKENINVYIPNIFSPNNDGHNDEFTIGALDGLVRGVILFSVYDRWGNLMYLLENVGFDEDIGWDGKFNNQLVQSGVYTYFIQLELIDGQDFNFSGSVTLVR
jgi:gliding motility-associated-like protein